MNYIKVFFSLIIISFTLSTVVSAADEATPKVESKEEEEKKEYIKDITKEFSKFEGSLKPIKILRPALFTWLLKKNN